MMTAVPLVLLLPDGPATLVPGSHAANQPRYERDGVVLDVDVSIPSELDANWFWDGSFLRLRTAPDACGVAICTKTFGVPGVFDQAREIDRRAAEWDAAPKKQIKIKGSKARLRMPDVPIVAVPEPELAYEMAEVGEQLVMELV
jgi:hypothetical protein